MASIRINVSLTKETFDELNDAVQPRKRSRFISKAIKDALRGEKAQRLAAEYREASAEIRRLNRQFLNSSHTTDCISFDLSDDTNSARLLELIVNGELAVRQARRRRHSPEAELALYITHGLLHNLGFNDLKVRQAKKMHDTEDEILQQFGYGLIYNSSGKEKA